MEIIGHRGARGLAVENSIEAIRKAVSLKVDMIEVDVRLQNGILVLSHNPVTKTDVCCPLKQVLLAVNGKIPINLEIKESKTLRKLTEILEAYKGEVVLSSFKFDILHKVRNLMPEREIAVLENWSGIKATAEAALLETKRIHMNQKWLWPGFIHSVNKQGYNLYAYTVNEIDRAKKLEEWGVKGIFTDYPNRFMRH